MRYAVEIADQVLIGQHDGSLLAIRPGEPPRVVTTSTTIPTGVVAAAPREDGTAALVSTDCCVYEASIDGDELTLSRPRCQAPDECEFVVDAVAAPTGRGLSWVTGEGSVVDLGADGRFERLGKLEDLRGTARIVRDDAGVLFAAQRGTHVAVADGSSFTLERPPIPGVNLTALAFAGPAGLLVGDSAGHVLRRTGPDAWEPLGDPGFFTGVTRMIAFPPDRFWAIGGSGEGAVWSGGEFCPLEQVGAGLVLFAPRFGGGWLFIGASVTGEGAVGIWIR